MANSPLSARRCEAERTAAPGRVAGPDQRLKQL